jgi:uncharacterized membrane protein (UPF0127 family)
MRALMLSLLLCLPACSQAAEPAPAPAAQASVHPVSGLEVLPLTVTTADGQVHAFQVEMARSGPEQAQGLMFRTQMGANEGMLFPYDQPRILSFWMKNTVLSLDIIFIGPDRRIVNVADHTVPYSEESVMSVAPAIAVLELNAGRAEELGITAGSKVDW